MKKLWMFAVAFCGLLALLNGCHGHHAHAAGKDFRVLASTFPVYLFTANICANAPGVKVELLVPASAGCPHDFALKPGDMRKLAGASCLVINGAGLEEFLDKAIAQGAPNLPVVDAGAGCPLLEGGEHGSNPHIFASPRLAARMTEKISAELGRLNPENASLYAANAGAYAESLLSLSKKLEAVGNQAANRRIALEHEALAYLADNANLEIALIFEQTGSASQLAQLEKELRAKRPAALAGDSQYPDRLLKTLAKETGIHAIQLNPCAGGPENAPLDYYQRIMEENLKILEASFDR